MREIIQEIHNLIGKPEDIAALAEKEQARVLVCSDSHGKASTLINIIKSLGSTCDAFAFCGDGTSDVVQTLKYAMQDEEFAECVPPVIAIVRGNGDPSFFPLDSEKSLVIPNSQILTVCGRNLMFVHGHRECVEFGMDNYGLQMQLNQCKDGFYGHTHIAREINTEGGYKIVNPGSCSRPRGGQPAGFAIVTVANTFVDVAFMKISMIDGVAAEFSTWSPVYY